mmetsp:Transcript_1903/g.11617  ORF Transcript_1903/g.11617 Transcript_1903/m.11617 type:complete len:93 (-) Transcript_1903:2571-2849(-)
MDSLSEIKFKAIVTVLQFAWHHLLHPLGRAFGAPPLDNLMHSFEILRHNYAEAVPIQSSLVPLLTYMPERSNSPHAYLLSRLTFLVVHDTRK